MKKTIIPIRILLVLSTFLLTVLLYIDRACISAAKDDICSDLGFDLTDFGWVMAVFTLGYALFQVPSGKLADKFGPRGVISGIVLIWSILTAVTGMAWNYVSMLVIRFFFGAGEAGAFPSLSKVVFNWFPVKERGVVQGINFSGSRLGAAFALPLVAWMITVVGWRTSFLIFGGFGILFGILWYLLFKNKPEESKALSEQEKKYILENRQEPSANKGTIAFSKIIKSKNVWMTMIQYVCSNFTFYFTLTWMFPFVKEKFGLSPVEAGLYSSIPLIAGAVGNWFGGVLVDWLYRIKGLKISRRIPPIIGFSLAAFGMIMVTASGSGTMAIVFLAIAVFGADMTLSPSWVFCIDIGKENAGAVSGTMNMAGNLGAFVTIMAYPYLIEWTGSNVPFFYIAASLSVVAIIMWTFMNPKQVVP
ncbi:MAG: MFS transporter [Prolixibacteraceae bacterium]|jgi:MFS transporter, ACS family, glucarate transporter|nr:MFS transporter [Prolixibacteraceae bacterium]MBT6006132.1 MFS transporter [Prolixibacteraceae bacterium]MBT6765065.1 MFS transporter [Prolixibacteraceae bacterium]MBT6998549.1 MFS transporter [Prolixibacteraceae bacterium]MBT7395737.1 MFS transporter [Prolixibacteraceae bacterium]